MSDPKLLSEFKEMVNRHRLDLELNIPDYRLASYLMQCLDALVNTIEIEPLLKTELERLQNELEKADEINGELLQKIGSDKRTL